MAVPCRCAGYRLIFVANSNIGNESQQSGQIMVLEEHILRGISHRTIEPLFDRQSRQSRSQIFGLYRQFSELLDYLGSPLDLVKDSGLLAMALERGFKKDAPQLPWLVQVSAPLLLVLI